MLMLPLSPQQIRFSPWCSLTTPLLASIRFSSESQKGFDEWSEWSKLSRFTTPFRHMKAVESPTQAQCINNPSSMTTAVIVDPVCPY